MFTYSHANTPLGQSERAYHFSYFIKENGSTPTGLIWDTNMATISLFWVACIAIVSVRFPGKERGTEVKDRAKNKASKRAGRWWGLKERKHSPLPLRSFFGSRSIFRAAKTGNPAPRRSSVFLF